MDLSFAKDKNIWSEAIESMRAENIPFTEENIKKRYEEIAKGSSKKSESSEEKTTKKAPKKTTKKADKE